jgi:glycosyltransferase involved in cell wall biosynthesis
MNKKTILFSGPVQSVSGYGSHARDLLKSLYEMELFEIRINSLPWGTTPLNALNLTDPFHLWIKSNLVNDVSYTPDIYIQVTIPSEFQRIGTWNIGITAGIETTVAPKNWIDGCNRMDLVLVPSKFSKDVLLSTVYNEIDNLTGKLITQHRINTKIEILFEGVDTSKFTNVYNNIGMEIDNPFSFLFVGHWLKGNLGCDRKDVGMLIKIFCETFKDTPNQPALLLKTTSSGFSVRQREFLIKRIKSIYQNILNPPPVYLIFGDLNEDEMNSLYNHPNVKTMISLTKGEGFGRPLLEFTMTGKPIIVSNWSGHTDFLPENYSILLGGKVDVVHESAVDDFIIKGSKWFTANYNEVSEVMKIVIENYDMFKEKSETLRVENKTHFSLEKMKNEFQKILLTLSPNPVEKRLNLPKLTKI